MATAEEILQNAQAQALEQNQQQEPEPWLFKIIKDGKYNFEAYPDMEPDAVTQVGYPMLIAAFALMNSEPARFGFGHGCLSPRTWIGFATDDWFRALMVVSYYYTKRRSPSKRQYEPGRTQAAQLRMPYFLSDESVAAGAPRLEMLATVQQTALERDLAADAFQEPPDGESNRITSSSSELEVLEFLGDFKKRGLEIAERLETIESRLRTDFLTLGDIEALRSEQFKLKEEFMLSTLAKEETVEMPPLSEEDKAYLKQHLTDIRGTITIGDTPPITTNTSNECVGNVADSTRSVNAALQLDENVEDETAGRKASSDITTKGSRTNAIISTEDEDADAEDLEYQELKVTMEKEASLAETRKANHINIVNVTTTGAQRQYPTLEEAEEFLDVHWQNAFISPANTGESAPKYQVYQLIGTCPRAHSPLPSKKPNTSVDGYPVFYSINTITNVRRYYGSGQDAPRFPQIRIPRQRMWHRQDVHILRDHRSLRQEDSAIHG